MKVRQNQAIRINFNVRISKLINLHDFISITQQVTRLLTRQFESIHAKFDTRMRWQPYICRVSVIQRHDRTDATHQMTSECLDRSQVALVKHIPEAGCSNAEQRIDGIDLNSESNQLHCQYSQLYLLTYAYNNNRLI